MAISDYDSDKDLNIDADGVQIDAGNVSWEVPHAIRVIMADIAASGLSAIDALTPSDGAFIVGDGSTWVAETGATARTSIGLGAADNVQFARITADSLVGDDDTDLLEVSGGTTATTGANLLLYGPSHATNADDIFLRDGMTTVLRYNKAAGQINVNYDITTSGTVDGRDVSADGTKLDGIEAGATADQTGAEIKTAYEAEANTNAFTDAEKTKLSGIETGADVTDTANVTAAGALMDSELTNEAAIKAIDQQLTTLNNVQFAGITAAELLNSAATGETNVSGGTSTVLGGNAAFFGQTHSTRAGDFDLRSAGTSIVDWDQSASELTISASATLLHGTYEIYHRNNIVGTVSETSGTPTGAVIETGSNANGAYTKFADGTMICRHTIDLGSIVAVGAGTRASPYQTATQNWTYPVAFATGTTPEVTCSGGVPLASASAARRACSAHIRDADNTTARQCQIARMTSDATADKGEIRLVAVGVWFT